MTYWLLFGCIVLIWLTIDLGFDRKRTPSRQEARIWTFYWIGVALLFATALFLRTDDAHANGTLTFLSTFAIAKSISLGHIIVIALLFSYYKVSETDQQRLLSSVIVGAILSRGLFLVAGQWLYQELWWLQILFGTILLFSSAKLLLIRHDRLWIEQADQPSLNRVFGLPALNYQLISSTALFSLDSVPATLVVTSDLFVTMAANVFAILGMRSLYFAVANALENYRFVKGSLGILLAILGVTYLTTWKPDSATLLVISVGLLIGAALLTRVARGWGPIALVSPLENKLEEIAILTLNQTLRLVILVLGSTILLMGLLMIVLPGPAIVFIPLGLLILSLEFAWAGHLLRRFREQGQKWFTRRKK